MRLSLILTAALAVSACTERAAEPPPAPEPAEAQSISIPYVCGAGQSAEARYAADGTVVVNHAGQDYPMNPAEAVSGARWTGADLEWWVTLESGEEVGTLRRLGPDRVGEAVVARCVRPASGGVLAPDPSAAGQANTPEPCASAGLALDVVSTEAGAGSRYTVLAFTNTGASACSLEGYPGLSLLGEDGAARGDLRVDQSLGPYYAEAGRPDRVVLFPGGRAFFDLISTAVAGEIPGETEPCRAITTVQAGPPGDAGNLEAELELNPCNGRVRVTPFRPVQELTPPAS